EQEHGRPTDLIASIELAIHSASLLSCGRRQLVLRGFGVYSLGGAAPAKRTCLRMGIVSFGWDPGSLYPEGITLARPGSHSAPRAANDSRSTPLADPKFWDLFR